MFATVDINAKRNKIRERLTTIESLILARPNIQVIRHEIKTNPPILIHEALNLKETIVILIDLSKTKRKRITIVHDKKQYIHFIILWLSSLWI